MFVHIGYMHLSSYLPVSLPDVTIWHFPAEPSAQLRHIIVGGQGRLILDMSGSFMRGLE